MAAFLPGLDLAESFYVEVVGARLAGIVHSAALIGPGSEVLAYDDVRSTDHYWGPRLQVFVDGADVEPARAALRELPAEHREWPTVIGSDQVPFGQHVDVWTVEQWLDRRLGVDPRRGLSHIEWLLIPQQLVLEATAGRVFHDGLEQLAPIRTALTWYPEDVWRWLMAGQWRRIAQEEPFVGRTAEVGDELGSRVVAARLVRDVMRLCFLIERRYAPYSKWLGTAFSGLPIAARVGPPLLRALTAVPYQDREAGLVEAYEAVARQHNALGMTEPQEPTVRRFHERPFRVIAGDRFADACLAAISDDRLRALPLVGGVDQWVDSTDVLSDGRRAHLLVDWYKAVATP